MERHKTAYVCRQLETNFSQLGYLIRTGRVRPDRDESGHYLWSRQDIETTRQALAALRPCKRRVADV